MISTADTIREGLNRDGLIMRYTGDDTLKGDEGAFIPCTFWLAECYAKQHRNEEARVIFDRAIATTNHLGLLAEEYNPNSDQMLGNFPQALTHLSHLAAAVSLASVQHLGQKRPA
jgi:GH15 family glucan-1,4-alpha-glucosidase